jgi:WD40 repeat protein
MNSDALSARIGNLLGSSASSSAENCPATPPPPVPDHQIIARIGSGSYGEVWLARSITGALRAVKVVWRSRFSSERPYDREFHGIVQFEPISRLHPGVVNVLHVGRDDAAGCFFYVMELADNAHAQSETRNADWPRLPSPPIAQSAGGIPNSYSPRTLASELKRTRLPIGDAVSLGVQLAGALGHLHRHGLVHRDVKPSNVIFVHGQAKLADIGLVTGIHEERSFVGTEGYIPPEGPGSERADLFGLGRLLYEAATGKNRFDFPGLPDDLDRWPKSDRDALIELNEILMRACDPDPKKRHSNAAELAGDLNLILAGRSVRRAYRIERRLRGAMVVSATASVLVFAAIFLNWFQHWQREKSEAHARRETALREEAQTALARAEAAERESQQQLHSVLLEQARSTVRSGEMGQRVHALDSLRRAAAISNSVELRREVFSALCLPDLRFERQLPLATNVTAAELDPAFERLAISRGTGPVEIRAVADNRMLALLPASTNLIAYENYWSPDGRFVSVRRDWDASGSRAVLEVWDVGKARRVFLLPDCSWGALSFHPHEPWILAVQSGVVAIWDLESGQELKWFGFSSNRVRLAKFSPDGKSFAALQSFPTQFTVTVRSASSGEELFSREFTEWIATLAWHPGGRWLALADHDGKIQLLDPQTGETHLLGRHKGQAVTLAFSPDGNYLMSGGWERELICWDVQTRQRAFSIGLDSYHLQFSADGRQSSTIVRFRTATTSFYRDLKLHAFEPTIAHREFHEDLGSQLRSAAFSPNGRWLAASATKRCGVWDLTGNGPGALDDDAYNTQMFFTRDERELFGSRTEEGNNECFRWQISPATNRAMPSLLTRVPLNKPDGFTSLAVHSNTIVFTGSKGSRLAALEDLENGSGHNSAQTSQGYNGISPDGSWLAIRRALNDTLYIHRLPGLEAVATLKSPPVIGDFDFSPLGDEIVACSSAGKGATFWRIGTWEKLRSLTNVISLHYTPDARALWLARDWRTAGLYDARTLELLVPLPAGMLPLALSPDGRHLAVSVDLRRLQVWDLTEVRRRLREFGLDWTENP